VKKWEQKRQRQKGNGKMNFQIFRKIFKIRPRSEKFENLGQMHGFLTQRKFWEYATKVYDFWASENILRIWCEDLRFLCNASKVLGVFRLCEKIMCEEEFGALERKMKGHDFVVFLAGAADNFEKLLQSRKFWEFDVKFGDFLVAERRILRIADFGPAEILKICWGRR